MMKKINTLLFLIYFFSFPMRGAVQSYIFHHWGLEDGMSNSLVVDMVQDKHNYFWIATEAGLSRFDGRTFQMYDTNNSDIAGNSLNTLYIWEQASNLYDEEENYIARDLEAFELYLVKQLPPQRQKIYLLSRYEDQNTYEISQRMHLSPRTVENHLWLGRKSVREYIRRFI